MEERVRQIARERNERHMARARERRLYEEEMRRANELIEDGFIIQGQDNENEGELAPFEYAAELPVIGLPSNQPYQPESYQSMGNLSQMELEGQFCQSALPDVAISTANVDNADDDIKWGPHHSAQKLVLQLKIKESVSVPASIDEEPGSSNRA